MRKTVLLLLLASIITLAKAQDIPVHSNKGYILFAAGRLIESKGCHILLQALNMLNYKGKIIVAGDYNQSSLYYEHLKELSIDLDCDFVGLVKEKNELFNLIAGATVFIYPSMLEAMSMMLLETASIGTPIICADIDGNKDVFHDNEVLFFKNNDVVDLSEKIIYSLSNIEEISERANNLKKRLWSDQSWNDIAIQYDNLYKQVLKVK